MKPAICKLCGKPSIDEKLPDKGDWVEFSEYEQPDPFVLGHPDGLEYFCYDHLKAARSLQSNTSTEALAELQKQFGCFSEYKKRAPVIQPWWRKLFSIKAK